MFTRYRYRTVRSQAGLLPAAVLFFSLAAISVFGGNSLLALCLLPAGLALDLARAEAPRSTPTGNAVEESGDAS